MPNTLRSSLDSLATNFACAVLDAIRGASLDELVGGDRRRTSTWPRPPSGCHDEDGADGCTGVGPGHQGKTKGGRLARRSPADIAKTLGQIVALVKTKKAGLRSEEIRKALKLDVREVPRVLKEGLAKKKLKSKGQKRATTYTAA